MGWLFGYGDTRKRVIEDRCREWTNEGAKAGCRTLKKCIRGNTLWTVRESWRINAEGVEEREKWIGCDLLASSGGDWGYKDLCETMGPAEVSCPLEYLDEVPVPDGKWAAAWRERVRAHHEKRRKRSVKKGDRAILVHTSIERLNGMTVEIEGRRRSKVMARASDGTLLLVPPACLERVA